MALQHTHRAEEISQRERHWEAIYSGAGDPAALSWHQISPLLSLQLIGYLGVPHDAAVIDVGGGASTLVAALRERGYRDITVLDVSATALEMARRRAGEDAAHWLVADVLAWAPDRHYDLWHDRAVLHFLVDPADRKRYLRTLRAALRPGGHAVIGTFAPEAPDRCSGLPVQRYDSEELLRLLGDDFEPLATRREVHHTPGGVAQPFAWIAVRYAAGRDPSGT